MAERHEESLMRHAAVPKIASSAYSPRTTPGHDDRKLVPVGVAAFAHRVEPNNDGVVEEGSRALVDTVHRPQEVAKALGEPSFEAQDLFATTADEAVRCIVHVPTPLEPIDVEADVADRTADEAHDTGKVAGERLNAQLKLNRKDVGISGSRPNPVVSHRADIGSTARRHAAALELVELGLKRLDRCGVGLEAGTLGA